MVPYFPTFSSLFRTKVGTTQTNVNHSTKAILDSCFLIRYLVNEEPSAEKGLLQELSVNGIQPCATKRILHEVERWVDQHRELTLRWGKIRRLLKVLKTNQGDVIWEAGHILTHYPDNQHIAAAKIEKSLLISYDHALIRTARDEGVEAYYPQELLVAN